MLIRIWAAILVLTLALSGAGCFKKKKDVSPFARYQQDAQTVIDTLRVLQNQGLNESKLNEFNQTLAKTGVIVEQFRQQSQDQTEAASRTEILAAWQDFQVTAQLVGRKLAGTQNHYASDKIFASSDSELFTNVKQRYQLGPALVFASQSYYYIDSIIHEAWRSAGRHLDRAGSKLNDEAAADLKARRAAKAAAKNLEKQQQQSPQRDDKPKN